MGADVRHLRAYGWVARMIDSETRGIRMRRRVKGTGNTVVMLVIAVGSITSVAPSTKHIVGEGTPEDYVTGYAWMNLASAQGVEHARESRDAFRNSILSRKQLAEAQRPREFQQQIDRQRSEN